MEKDEELILDAQESTHTEHEYGGSEIQVLEGLEAVRKRPGMYIGSTSASGLHHLVYEIVDNAIDEALAGYCTHITVDILPGDVIKVTDNGRGVPVDIQPQTGKPALEVVYTVLHAGGKFGGGGYKVSGGLHGVGVSCVNALSTYLRAEVHRNGKAYVQEYSCGKPTTELVVAGESDNTGTMITFKPDGSIFTVTEYDYSTLANRLRDLAFLNAGITLHLTDMRRPADAPEDWVPRSETFYSQEGLKEFVRYIDSNKESLINDVIDLRTERQGIPVEVALTYNSTYNETVFSFVNNINTIEGGTHLTGFRRGLTSTLKKYAEDNNLLKKRKSRNFLRRLPRRPHSRSVGKSNGAAVRRTDQNQTRQQRSDRSRADRRIRRPPHLPRRAPQAGKSNSRQSNPRRTGTPRRLQRPQASAPQVAPQFRRTPRQTLRLLEPHSRRLRTLHRRG